MDLCLCLPFRCFISPTPTSCSADIVVNNLFFVARDHTLQEWIIFFAFDRRRSCDTQTSSFFTKPSDFKWPWTLPTDTFRAVASSRILNAYLLASMLSFHHRQSWKAYRSDERFWLKNHGIGRTSSGTGVFWRHFCRKLDATFPLLQLLSSLFWSNKTEYGEYKI